MTQLSNDLYSVVGLRRLISLNVAHYEEENKTYFKYFVDGSLTVTHSIISHLIKSLS